MKKLLLATTLLLAACDAPVEIQLPVYHQTAKEFCSKNGGYESYRIWKSGTHAVEHLAIICNDKAEIYIYREGTYGRATNNVTWSNEWKPDSARYY